MALASASCKTVSRGAGRSATAAAAYRTATRITDQRTGEVHDYRRRGGVDHVSMHLPTGAPAMTTEQLWNKVEASETRKNSTVARELVVALPHELDQVQRRALAERVAGQLVERYQVAAQVAVHLPDDEGDQRNHHAHILFTTRQMDASGDLGAKTRQLDDLKTGPQEVLWMREMVETETNAGLEMAGSAERIDMRSLAAQRSAALATGNADRAAELDRPATLHEGPRVTQIRREAKRAGRAPLGALDRAAANDQNRQLDRDRNALRWMSIAVRAAQAREQARVNDVPATIESAAIRASEAERREPFVEPSLAEQLREQEPPAAVEPVREAQPAAEKLTGSAAIRALIPEGARRDGPVPGIRERMAEVLAKLDAGLGLSPREAAVPEKAPPAAVAATPEPAPQVKPVTKAPSAAQIELAALKAKLVPVETLVAADSKVIKAKEEFVRVEAEVAEARGFAVLIPKAVAKFRAEHPVLAARHDMGWKVNELQNAEEDLQAAHHTLRYAEGNVRRARESVGHEERAATDRVREANRPVMARIAELESVVAREQAAEGPSIASAPSQRRSAPVQRSERAYRPHVDRDEPERGMD